MNEPLHWAVAEECLTLSGELNRETLRPLWHQRHSVMADVNRLDVSRLSHVDTAGLALLVHLREAVPGSGKVLQFTGITEKLHALIRLYNLQQLIVTP